MIDTDMRIDVDVSPRTFSWMTEIIRQGVEQCLTYARALPDTADAELIESHIEDARHVLMELIRIGGKVRIK